MTATEFFEKVFWETMNDLQSKPDWLDVDAKPGSLRVDIIDYNGFAEAFHAQKMEEEDNEKNQILRIIDDLEHLEKIDQHSNLLRPYTYEEKWKMLVKKIKE